MGIAVAEALIEQGADVTLIMGPSKETVKYASIKIERIKTAADMLDVVEKYFDNSDITVMAAAVADYTPVKKAPEKIKKQEDEWNLSLKKTIDILKELGKKKRENQLLVGFALETSNPLAHANKKLESKNLDFIVLNTLNDGKSGFEFDTNKITIIDKNQQMIPFQLKSKKEVARDIVQHIITLLHA
jgi:phosphopantothenoylcysteine decarboxylase/phosphopantothenate--cysteine ligase